jgi:hypothetical protein
MDYIYKIWKWVYSDLATHSKFCLTLNSSTGYFYTKTHVYSCVYLERNSGVYRLWGPPSLLSSGYRGLFPGAKRPGSETHYSPPSSAEVKNGGAIPPLHPYVFMAWCLIKHKDNFTGKCVKRKL